MNVVAPTFELRAPCPCCGQGGLSFSTCPTCQRVVLICEEVGTVFPDPQDLSQTTPQLYGGGATCPSCGGPPLREFRASTSDEIKALGFTHEDYK